MQEIYKMEEKRCDGLKKPRKMKEVTMENVAGRMGLLALE